MGCVVNGPGESKHANIGISLPGTNELPVAPVYVDGVKTVTLKGERIAEEFQAIVEDYVRRNYAPGAAAGARRDARSPIKACLSAPLLVTRRHPGGPRHERRPAGRGRRCGSGSRASCAPGSRATATAPSARRCSSTRRCSGARSARRPTSSRRRCTPSLDELNGESLTLRPGGAPPRACAPRSSTACSTTARSASGTPGRCTATSGRRRGATASSTSSAPRRSATPGPDVDAELIVMCARLWTDLGLRGHPPGAQHASARPRSARATATDLVAPPAGARGAARRRREAAPAHESAARARHEEPDGAGGGGDGAARCSTTSARLRSRISTALQRLLAAAGVDYHDQPAPGARAGLLQPHRVRVDHRPRSARRARCAAAGATTACSRSSAASPRRACGFAMGVERLVALMRERGPGAGRAPRRDAYLVHQGEGTLAYAFALARGAARARATRWCCTRAAAASSRR